jgi:hypothetical protein
LFDTGDTTIFKISRFAGGSFKVFSASNSLLFTKSNTKTYIPETYFITFVKKSKPKIITRNNHKMDFAARWGTVDGATKDVLRQFLELTQNLGAPALKVPDITLVRA